MATNTTNLNLLKKDPITDGNDTFNIQTMLNDNWDKIDAAWVNKANASDLTSHTGNTTVHITADERKAWNAKANASHTHTIGNITNLQTTLDSKANTSDLTNLSQEIEETISSHVDETNRQSTTLQHGLSVINGEVASPTNIEVQGRTLTSLGNSTLESSKYYVLADNKTKLKWADSSITTGVAKFTGKAEKPTIIRISNFENKVSGSTVDNPNELAFALGSALSVPSSIVSTPSQVNIDNVKKLDGTKWSTSATTSGQIPQQKFSFNLIEEIERNIGKIPGSTTAEKVQWLRSNITRLSCNWHGYGSSAVGNKATFGGFARTLNNWYTDKTTTVATISKLTFATSQSNTNSYILDDGFSHFIAYAEPSDGTTASTIYTDYVELEIELKPTATLNSACVPLYEVDSEEYSKILTEWDENAVLSRYPKVEGTQHLQGIAMFAEGANLLPPFTEWSLRDVAKVISPYEIELNATGAGQDSPVIINAMPSTTYTFNWEGNGITYVDSLKDGTLLKRHAERSTDKTITFTTADTANQIRIFLGNGNTASGKFTFKNPMLTLGSTPKPFVPRNPSHLYADVTLGQIGTMKDVLYKQEGQWLLRKVVDTDSETPALLPTPQIINVTDKIEGDIVVNGLTQVEVTSGVIVREKAVPVLYTDYYRLNDVNVPLSLFKYSVDKILSVYKNGIIDTKWVIQSVPTNGKQRAIITQADYDPTATYTVTYLALDRYQMTVNATEVKATYANNIRSALDDVVVKQSDIETSVKTAYDLAQQAFQSASDGKTKIATAITGKGVTTSASDTFDKMAENIGKIETGKYGNATANDVIQGKTIGTENGIVTGNIPNYGRAVLGQEYTSPKSYLADGGGSLVIEPKTGYYEEGLNNNGFGSIILSDGAYKAHNIKKGTSIFGLAGTLDEQKSYAYVKPNSSQYDMVTKDNNGNIFGVGPIRNGYWYYGMCQTPEGSILYTINKYAEYSGIRFVGTSLDGQRVFAYVGTSLYEFNTAGTLIKTYALGHSMNNPGNFIFESNNRFYLVATTKWVYCYDKSFNFIAYATSSYEGNFFVSHPQGLVWFCQNNVVQFINESGVLTAIPNANFYSQQYLGNAIKF